MDVLIPIDTTDVQSVSASTGHGEKAPTVTCHFAKGTNCTGCCLDYWSTDTPESIVHHYLNISRSPDLLEANGTIDGLVPGKTYMLKAYDIEWDESISTDVGVTLKGELSIDNERARGMQCIFPTV